MIELGELSLWIAMLMAAWGTALLIAGSALSRDDFVSSGLRGLLTAVFFVALAMLGLGSVFASDAFEFRSVALFSSDRVPVPYRMTFLWAGRPGALLLWIFVFAVCFALAVRRLYRVGCPLPPARIAVLGFGFAALLALEAFALSPFSQTTVDRSIGSGLNPQLLDRSAVFAAPLLAVGSAFAAVSLMLAMRAPRRLPDPTAQTAGAWASAAACVLLAGTELRFWSVYLHRGVAPSIRALGLAPTGTAFGLFLAIAMAILALRARPRRRVELLVATCGAALVLVGVASQGHHKLYDVVLHQGETVQVLDAFGAPWSFTSQGTSRRERPNYVLSSVALLPSRKSVRQPFITVGLREYHDDVGRGHSGQGPDAGVSHYLEEDVYVTVSEITDDTASIRIRFNPLVSCAWIGGALVIAGLLGGVRSEYAVVAEGL